jgi:glycosyltransferase involved in cell wall biosynthesis
MAQDLGLHSEVIGAGPMRIPDNPLEPKLFHQLQVRGPNNYGYSPGLRAWCRANLRRFDGVLLHGMWGYQNWAVSRECIAIGLPYVCFPHGMLDLWSVRGQGLWKRAKKTVYWFLRERSIIAASSAVFFTTKRELQNACRTFRLPHMQPLIVIPYGMAPPIFNVETSPRAEIVVSPKTKIALFLGRVHPKKRPDLLIKAWKAAAPPPQWLLVIAGPGEPRYLRHLSSLARNLNVSDTVRFTGPVAGADKQYLLNRASWFLLPSEQENFGVAALEAITVGCAVALSDQVYLGDKFPKPSEILPIDVEAWARFMAQRMIDDRWRDEIAARIKDEMLLTYNSEQVTRGWVRSISSVLTEASPKQLLEPQPS